MIKKLLKGPKKKPVPLAETAPATLKTLPLKPLKVSAHP